MKQSFIFLADGFETIEALTPLDVFRRAGLPVKTVSISSSKSVTSAQNVQVTADVLFDPTLFTDPEWLILPGGMHGATNLFNYAPLTGLLRKHAERNGKIASICASPAVVLGQLGLLKGHKATCYPGFESMLNGAEYVDAPVIVDRNFVLGDGPADALTWSLTILKEAAGAAASDKIAADMLYFRNLDEIDNFFG